MTPEERANQTLRYWVHAGIRESVEPASREGVAMLLSALTAAIEMAENDAYDRAALLAHSDCDRHGTQELGRMILDLKHKQEQA